MKRIPKFWCQVMLYVACLTLASLSSAASKEERLEKIKAGYLVNFIRFAQWPDESFESASSPVVVTIVGDSPFSDSTIRGLEKSAIGQRSLELRQIPLEEVEQVPTDVEKLRLELADVHVVFMSGLNPARAEELVREILPKHTLSIGDHEMFARIGVMLALSTDDNKVVFYANSNAIKLSEVKLSSKVLRLARKLKG